MTNSLPYIDVSNGENSKSFEFSLHKATPEQMNLIKELLAKAQTEKKLAIEKSLGKDANLVHQLNAELENINGLIKPFQKLQLHQSNYKL